MRVLLTTDTIGGVWTFTKELTSELLLRGHSVALASFGRAPTAEQKTWFAATHASHGELFRYESSDTPLEWMSENHTAYSGGERLLLRLIDEFSPDLMHANQFCFGALPAAMPRLITAHSDVLSWASCCRPEGLPVSRWLQQYNILVSRGIRAADAIVAPTRWMLDALKSHFGFGSPSYVIHNGRSIPAPPENAVPNAQAISVGRLWDDAKNLRLLTRVQPPFPIFAAGERTLEEEALNTSDLGPVTLLGPLPEHELLKVFRQSSIYIVPSLYEPFGLAPLEAALCGCAVLANNIPSLREVWCDSALYFKDETSLTKTLWELHHTPGMLEVARHRSRARALQLSSARMAEDYLSLYKSLVGSVSPLSTEELAAHAF